MFPPIAGIIRLYRSALNALPGAPRTGSRPSMAPRDPASAERNL